MIFTRVTQCWHRRRKPTLSYKYFPAGVGEIDLTLVDTVGFGAADVENADIAKQVMEYVLKNSPSQLNGIVLVHKAERYREDYAQQVAVMQKIVATLGATVAHVLVVVTHTLQYSEEMRQEYSDKLFQKLRGVVQRNNIVHANFANWVELSEEAKQQFQRMRMGGLFESKMQIKKDKPLKVWYYSFIFYFVN